MLDDLASLKTKEPRSRVSAVATNTLQTIGFILSVISAIAVCLMLWYTIRTHEQVIAIKIRQDFIIEQSIRTDEAQRKLQNELKSHTSMQHWDNP